MSDTERLQRDSSQASQPLGKGPDLPGDRACSYFRSRRQRITRSSAESTASSLLRRGPHSLFPAEKVKKAKQYASESFQGTYEQVSRQSLTAQQHQRVIHTKWTFEDRSSLEGESSLRARLVDPAFQQQLLDHDSIVSASISHMSLKILLTLSLINRWAVSTATISSVLLPAPIASACACRTTT